MPDPVYHFVFDQKYDLSVRTNKDISNNITVLTIDITVYINLIHKPFHINGRWVPTVESLDERINP